MPALATPLIAIPLLLILSIVISKGAGRFGIPALSIFLAIGVIVGRLQPESITVVTPALAQMLGILALIFILHSGGLGTRPEDVRAVRGSALVLSTAGVLVSTALAAVFAVRVLHFAWLPGLLLGATITATDVAAVFTILRSRSVGLRGRIRPLLELESALNDPMSVFLSVGLLILIERPAASLLTLVPMFFRQMALGTVIGFVAGRATRWATNRIDLEFEGLYPVLSVAFVLLTFGVTQAVDGSGFLAVYVSGVVLASRTYVHQRSLEAFHDGLAWLMQITMFLTMGLLVRPEELWQVVGAGLALSAFLVFVARPASVFACLTPFRIGLRDQLMVSWGGLRGAVPIVLATYPLIAGTPGAHVIFNLVFFVVLTSVIVQGTTIPIVSRWLQVADPIAAPFRYPIEFTPTAGLASELVEVPVPDGSGVIGRTLVELALPAGALVVLIRRGQGVIVPSGGTRIEAGDRLLVLAEPDALARLRDRVERR
jgi:cell volume regulation protein A